MNDHYSDLDKYRDTNICFMLDANCINARQKDAALNRLEALHDDELIEIILCETSFHEACAGGGVGRFRKAVRFGVSITHLETQEEQQLLQAIEQAVFPNGAKTRQQKNDVVILFNAHKYGRILITDDGDSKRQPRGILGSRDELLKLGVRVMRPEEAVRYAEQRASVIKDQVRKICSMDGTAVPHWAKSD